MIVEECLAPKRRPHLLCMSILLITDGLPADFVVEQILGWEAGLDEAVQLVHVLMGRSPCGDGDRVDQLSRWGTQPEEA